MKTMNAPEIGMFIANTISLGIAKNTNRDGENAKFVAISYGDAMCANNGSVTRIIFEDQFPGLFEFLSEFKTGQKDRHEGELVDVEKVATCDALNTGNPNIILRRKAMRYMDLLAPDGAMYVTMPLKKGACYGNQRDGSPALDKDGKPVVVDSVRVFAQASMATIDDNGEIHYTWKVDPASERDNIERRFYIHPVEPQATINVAPSSAVPQPEPAPTPQPAQQAQPAQPAPAGPGF